MGSGEYDRQAVVDKMSETIAHRGPDSEGSFVDDYVGIGFRRLSIIDLEGGSQPIHSADGRYVLVFNGEIYNYRELRQELIENHGCQFQTNSDTEVILQTYQVYGKETASRLRGMFAFVIYDKETHSLYGARDYFGIKPLYYGIMNDTFFFGSEIKSFLPHPDFKKEVNPEAVKMYLIFQYSALPETMFKGVYKMTPGSYFTYENGKFEETRIFDATFETTVRTLEETVDAIDQSVLESVEYHQISDVEVGSFLSAGVDSSYVASTVRPMKTYSVGFEVGGFDETQYSRELCDILHITNQSREISADDFFDVLPEVQYHSDEPHANLSAIPLYYLAELASKDVKVVLSGEGADEMFGGYETYLPSRAGNFYRKIVPKGVRAGLAKAASKLPKFKGQAFLERNVKTMEDSYIGQAFIMDNDEADEILKPAYRSERTYQDVTRPYFDQVKDYPEVHKKMFLDMHLWLPNDILLKADKMTMAHSLELRVPFLDREVWKIARTLDAKYDVEGHETKMAFRKAALTHIPSEWADRKKLGFLVPFRVWLTEEKYYSQVKKYFEQDFVATFFDQELLLKWLDDHYQKKANNCRKIYTVYSFLLWYEQYFLLR